ncbi:MAG: hypothetical protein KDD70_09945 [Bdellovibrionales bacterium]|nr:hypothetical protein [Bdellovibrionales bacterium]
MTVTIAENQQLLAQGNWDQQRLFDEGAEAARRANIDLDLISRPPAPELKLTVMVPVRNEFSEGYVIDLIERFARQRIPKGEFELLLAVNNTKNDIASADDVVADNQNSLLFLRAIEDPTAPVSEHLPKRAKEVIALARAEGLAVGVIDLATAGIEKSSMGKVRDFISDIATARFGKVAAGELGILQFFDADAPIGRNFIQNISAEFADESVDTVLCGYDFAASGDRKVFESSEAYSWLVSSHAFEACHTVELPGEHVSFGGPLLATRVGALKRINGVPHVERGEDMELIARLSQQGEYRVVDSPTVTITDRAKADGFMSGSRYDSLQRPNGWGNYQAHIEWRSIHPKYQLAMDELQKRSRESESALSIEVVQGAFIRYGLPLDDKILRKFGVVDSADTFCAGFGIITALEKLSKKTNVPYRCRTEEFGLAVAETVRNVVSSDAEAAKLFDKLVHRSLLRAAVRHGHLVALIDRALDISYEKPRKERVTLEDFKEELLISKALERQPWMIDELNDLKEKCRNPKKAKKELIKRFPHQLSDFSEPTVKRSKAYLLGVTSFVRAVKANPVAYSAAWNALSEARFGGFGLTSGDSY